MTALSIIVPFYNVEAYLDECLASIMVQDFGDWEAILVDDASTDGSRVIADAAASIDNRFRVFACDCNRGQSAARNIGLESAQGDYVLFLDADDRYASGALSRLVEYARAYNLDCLDFSASSFYEDGVGAGYTDDYAGRTSIPGVFSGAELFCRYQSLREYYCSPCMHLIKRSMLEDANLRFLEGYTHEDELFSPLMHAYAQRAAFLNEELYQRRVRSGSTMTTKRGMRNISCMFKMSQELYAWLIEHGDTFNQAFRDALAQRVFELREIAALDAANAATADELDDFAATLPLAERIDFDLFVRQPALGYLRALDEARASHSFKLGSTLLAGPIWVKDYVRSSHLGSE